MWRNRKFKEGRNEALMSWNSLNFFKLVCAFYSTVWLVGAQKISSSVQKHKLTSEFVTTTLKMHLIPWGNISGSLLKLAQLNHVSSVFWLSQVSSHPLLTRKSLFSKRNPTKSSFRTDNPERWRLVLFQQTSAWNSRPPCAMKLTLFSM